MRILIMRHGEAQTFAHTDPLRPLTTRGEQDSVNIAAMLSEKGLGHIDVVWVSPYLRAEQTWRAVQTHIEAKQVQTEEGITPYGDPEQVASYIKAFVSVERPDSLMLVSHLPLVGYLTAELVPNLPAPMFPTSTVACIEYDPDTEQSELLWMERG
ncbi:phosphohistidine phosphatase SixA [Thaumasiovibrio sp. DFM-14]|uniref:phosphohistidine phosphatase SixA n=1 Tax=Thaumasiovibrio sp. DFM-14 TaxID=3384792 RepID=UPI0039A26FCF